MFVKYKYICSILTSCSCKSVTHLLLLVITETQPMYCTENPTDTQIFSIIARFINMDATVSCVVQFFHVGRLKQHVVLDTDQCLATVAVKRKKQSRTLWEFHSNVSLKPLLENRTVFTFIRKELLSLLM